MKFEQDASKKGRIEVVCGSMFSGKTEELMRRLKRAEYAQQHVITIKHHIDKRKNQEATCIISHEGRERFAFAVGQNTISLDKILELADEQVDVIGIDEVQFFTPEIVQIICKLIDAGKRVIVAGLDLDFRGEPFGIMPILMSIADEVVKLKAICVQCGQDAHYTQRLIDGRPARYADPVILVGAEELYEARCRDCFQIDRNAQLSISIPVVTAKEITTNIIG